MEIDRLCVNLQNKTKRIMSSSLAGEHINHLLEVIV